MSRFCSSDILDFVATVSDEIYFEDVPGEWVPFGDNAIVFLLEKLGCQDRVQVCMHLAGNTSKMEWGKHHDLKESKQKSKSKFETWAA
jgi:hypothetical protein